MLFKTFVLSLRDTQVGFIVIGIYSCGIFFPVVGKAVKRTANKGVNQNIKCTGVLRGAIQRINPAWLELTQV
jgi:hypothetical protein